MDHIHSGTANEENDDAILIQLSTCRRLLVLLPIIIVPFGFMPPLPVTQLVRILIPEHVQLWSLIIAVIVVHGCLNSSSAGSELWGRKYFIYFAAAAVMCREIRVNWYLDFLLGGEDQVNEYLAPFLCNNVTTTRYDALDYMTKNDLIRNSPAFLTYWIAGIGDGVGHVGLQLINHTYISKWPMEAPVNIFKPVSSCQSRSLLADIQSEGRLPDRLVFIPADIHLNVPAMLQAYDMLSQESYALSGLNCAATVLQVLQAGGLRIERFLGTTDQFQMSYLRPDLLYGYLSDAIFFSSGQVPISVSGETSWRLRGKFIVALRLALSDLAGYVCVILIIQGMQLCKTAMKIPKDRKNAVKVIIDGVKCLVYDVANSQLKVWQTLIGPVVALQALKFTIQFCLSTVVFNKKFVMRNR